MYTIKFYNITSFSSLDGLGLIFSDAPIEKLLLKSQSLIFITPFLLTKVQLELVAL